MLKIRLGGQVYIMPIHKNMHMMKILVNEDTNLELRSFEFRTPLRHALFDGQHKIFELLISFGVNVNSLTLDRDSLLHCCVEDDEKLDSAKILLLIGALLTFRNQQRKNHLKLPYRIKNLVQQ